MNKHLLDSKEFKRRQLLEFPTQDSFDFHLLGKITLYDIEKSVLDFIAESISRNYKYITIICGNGTFVRPNVQKTLKQHISVESFKDGGYYTGGKGAIHVVLR